MSKLYELTIKDNRPLADAYFEISWFLDGAPEDISPGQFLNIYLPCSDTLLPRPFSIFNFENGVLSVVYKVVGHGTDYMSRLKKGEKSRLLLPLGNHFPMDVVGSVALVAGGVGLAPVFFWGQRYLSNGGDPRKLKIYYGAQSGSQILFKESSLLTSSCVFCTDDGSLGFKGNCVERLAIAIKEVGKPEVIMACGPSRMLSALSVLASKNSISTYLSLEERMGCGFGACVGCAVRKKEETPDTISYSLVCKDGPVFKNDEVQL